MRFRSRTILRILYAFTLLHLMLSGVRGADQYELIPTGRCKDSSSRHEYYGAISSDACQKKCDEIDICTIYASKENEFCTVYEKCDVVPGSQWGGNFYRKKAAKHEHVAYETIPTGHCQPGNYEHTSYPGFSSIKCALKCKKDESCKIFYTKDTKDRQICTLYQKCTIVPGTQWGGTFYRKVRAGPKGKQGIPGPKGKQGIPGPKGNDGQKGERGEKGATGAPGIQIRDFQGMMKGAKGDPGIQGMQ